MFYVYVSHNYYTCTIMPASMVYSLFVEHEPLYNVPLYYLLLIYQYQFSLSVYM